MYDANVGASINSVSQGGQDVSPRYLAVYLAVGVVLILTYAINININTNTNAVNNNTIIGWR
ncbi:hypothetical protein [Candidatus Enterococcus ikei]|uniref:Uncharacterized protein n=1 Tax=Candidatus Enterococcus ikei TaxID=2815326 RepID=A0ABS3H1N4_9ENTE|nr:hypothetical protein [Enterococcus sp. DIV0869a]MBO0441431.1 hypothetical protein [Enterococcus sp. DIV0869a]